MHRKVLISTGVCNELIIGSTRSEKKEASFSVDFIQDLNLMSVSCHLDRAPNDEFSVECLF